MAKVTQRLHVGRSPREEEPDQHTERDRTTAPAWVCGRYGPLGAPYPGGLAAIVSQVCPTPFSTPPRRPPPAMAATATWPPPTTRSTWIWRSPRRDRKSTRLNSSHMSISYAVF